MWDKVTFIQETWPRKEGLRRSWERDTGKSKTPSMHVHPFKTSTPVWILSKFYYLLTIKIDVTSRRNIYIHTCLCSLFLKNFHVERERIDDNCFPGLFIFIDNNPPRNKSRFRYNKCKTRDIELPRRPSHKSQFLFEHSVSIVTDTTDSINHELSCSLHLSITIDQPPTLLVKLFRHFLRSSFIIKKRRSYLLCILFLNKFLRSS